MFAADRLAFGHPQQVVAFRSVISRSLRYWLVEKICSSVGSASRSRSNSEPSDSGLRAAADEPIEVVQRHVGIADTRQMLGQLIADRGQQIERQARPWPCCTRLPCPRSDIVQLPNGLSQPAASAGWSR